MASTPVVSFSTIGILSDILKELPLVNYVESSPDSNDSSGYPKPNEPGSTMHKLALLESAIQRDRATKLLESSAADQNFVDVLTKTLSLIDTSKISMKPEFVKPVPGLNELPPLLRSSISYNPKLFNGVFQDRLNQAATTSQVRPNNEQSHVLKQEQTPPKSAYLADNQKQNYNNATISHPSQAKQQDLKSTEESIQTKKFYSSSTSSMTTQPQQPQPKKEPKKEPNHQQMQLQQQQQQQHKQGANKVALSTWQADLASQLALPDDFTPELISMLAAEGYDVVSAATSRKPRSRATQQHQQHQQKMLDLSDDDDDEEKDVYQPATSSKTAMKTEKKSSEQQSVVRPMPLSINKQAARSELLKYEDPTEHPSFKRFAQMLDDLLESYESELQSMTASRRNGENLGDDVPSEYLMPKQTCSELVQEAFKLSSYSILHLIRTDCLFKLQNLLFYNIKDGVRSLHLMNEDKSGGHQQDKVFLEILHEKLLRASDCSIVALIIMTSPQMPKEIVIEDVIEQIASFVKLQLTETIFPAYDSVYKPVAVPSSSDSKPTPSSKRKLANQFNTAATSSTAGGGGLSAHRQKQQMNYYYTRIREMLSLVGDLICQIDLTDTIVITLTSFSVMCFFVENINELQLEALKILTNLFSRYPKHRQLVIDDILSSLAKIHPSKRNSRTYKCFNGDSIQMFTALVLQLLQSEVSPIDYVDSALMTSEDYSKRSYEEKESYLLNSFEDANQTAKKFLSVFFSKCKTKQADVDYRPLFESFIQDLLTIVNKPEWPIAEIILNMLGIVLVNQVQNDQSDVSSRVNSLEYLGQIVSQLRKDSLEYQKYPERVTNVLEKIKSDPNEINNVDTNLTNSDLFSMQKSLIGYLDSLLGNDAALQFSKYFLVAQWLKELCNPATKTSTSESSDNTIEIHSALYNQRKRVYELIERTGTIKNQQQQQTATTTTTSLQLDINEALTLTKYLCSLKKTLDKNFDFYLITILNLSGAGLETNTPTQVRSKAIKCLSLIIEVDPQILLKPKVYACVEANFLHPTISVREASVDLIGKFISHKPELTNHYYKLLSDRILDVGVSVRKRVIKIFRDICLNQPEFEALSEVCVKILRRIVDEDNIKKLVIETFYSLWFAPLNNNKEALLRRVLNMVDVVSEFSIITNIQNLELFEILFSSLLTTPNSASGGSSSAMSSIKIEDSTSSTTTGSGGAQASNEQELQAIRSKDVVRSCKQIVDCLISNVLNTEANASSPQAYKRLVASFATLFLLSKIKPDNFVNHAETLLPYLNIKSTNQNDNQIINSAAKILECVVPLLQSPSNSFLISLEESLCKLIFQGGMMIVSSCISCLGTVINKLTKNYKLAADCLFKFYNNAVHLKRNIDPKKPMEAGVKPSVLRMLFTLGLLAKHFDVESEELREFNKASTSKQELFDIFLYFVRTFGDVDVQQKALNGLGSFLTRNSEYMMRDEIKSLYMDCMKRPDAPINLKSQVFMNLTDYLAEEDQKNLAKSVELSKSHMCKDDLKEMLDVQSGMASTIIQSYLRPILDSYLTSNGGLRTHVFNCLSLILNQGLVYPIECVPYLIAMTTDPEKKIQTKALTQLTSLQKAHPNFVQTKSIMGINVSFHLQSIIKRAELAIKMQQSGASSIDPTMRIIRGFSELTETLSLNHHLYSLLRTNKNNRRAFLQQILKMFDDSSLNHHTNLAHMLYLADNLAYFPYQLMDEPLYLIHQIDLIISVTGINLLQMFRENLLNHRETASMRQTGGDEINREASNEQQQQQQQQQLDLGLDCPDEADDDMTNNSLRPTNIGNNNSNLVDKNGTNNGGNKNQMDDDEEETFESVFSNLPADLKPLKDCMYKAQGCCLLLILKQFLKEVYSISDSKIQNYSPTDTAKVNDRPITSRKTNRRFNPKKIMDYILRSDRNKEENDETKQALVTEYLEFKELMLSIDQEEKIDENKPNNPGGSKTNAVDASKLALLHQKLFEGIEKTKGTSNGQDSVQATPKSKAKSSKSANRSSTKKSGAGGKSSAAKRKRKNDSDLSSESDSNSDFDDED